MRDTVIEKITIKITFASLQRSVDRGVCVALALDISISIIFDKPKLSLQLESKMFLYKFHDQEFVRFD